MGDPQGGKPRDLAEELPRSPRTSLNLNSRSRAQKSSPTYVNKATCSQNLSTKACVLRDFEIPTGKPVDLGDLFFCSS